FSIGRQVTAAWSHVCRRKTVKPSAVFHSKCESRSRMNPEGLTQTTAQHTIRAATTYGQDRRPANRDTITASDPSKANAPVKRPAPVSISAAAVHQCTRQSQKPASSKCQNGLR